MLNDVRDVITPHEAKEILRIGTNKIYELLSDGSLKSIRCGNKYLIPKVYLEDFLLKDYNSSSIDCARYDDMYHIYYTEDDAVAS